MTGLVSSIETGTGAANWRVSRMKNSLPAMPWRAGVVPVSVVAQATIVDEGRTESAESSK
jgi:hypothetical protein